MFAETGILFPYFQSFSQEVHHLEEFWRIQKTNASNNIVQTTNVSEYDLGGEGDLFKAPEPIVEEPVLQLDPMAAAMSMISNGEDVISAETIKVTDIESIQSGHLLSEVFYECKKDLLANSAIEEPYPPDSHVKVPSVQVEEALIEEKERLISLGPMQKSVSSESLSSMEWMSGGCAIRPSFLDFHNMDLEAAFCMRRTCSEGDIQTLSNGNQSVIRSPFERVMTIGNNTIEEHRTIEERRQKLSRYRNKKSKRNFGRKIKYACRKALADSQPRVRGRFAKTEEAEVSSLSKWNDANSSLKKGRHQSS